MLLAQFEAYYSRSVAPTRRVSLGDMLLPVDPAPGFGGALLGGIVARFSGELDDDLDDELDDLVAEMEAGRRVAQPRFRHRLQDDKIGLQRCRHRLVGSGEQIEFEFDSAVGSPAQHVVCAVYAAATLDAAARGPVFAAVRKGLSWIGAPDHRLISHLLDRRAGSPSHLGDPVAWALDVLDLTTPNGSRMHRREVQRAYRDQLIDAHPDHGGDTDEAADRIAALGEARRILLGA